MPSIEIHMWSLRVGPRLPHQQVAQLHFRTAQLTAEAQVLFDNGTYDKQEGSNWTVGLRELIDRADRLDFEYQEWIDRYSKLEPWHYKTIRPPSWVCLPD